jgi:hypothetical protein
MEEIKIQTITYKVVLNYGKKDAKVLYFKTQLTECEFENTLKAAYSNFIYEEVSRED